MTNLIQNLKAKLMHFVYTSLPGFKISIAISKEPQANITVPVQKLYTLNFF